MITKELEMEVSGKGQTYRFTFRQLKRSATAYLYEGTDTDGNKTWEAFRRMEQKEADFKMGGKDVHKDREVRYPGDEAFGKWAWCFRKLEDAEECFQRLSEGTDEFPL